MPIEDMLVADRRAESRRRGRRRILAPDRGHDHEGVNFDAVGMSRRDEVRQCIEAGCDSYEIRTPLERIQVPGISTPADLIEDDIGLAAFAFSTVATISV